MNQTMKWTTIVLLFIVALPVAAQRNRNFTFEIGVNHAVNLGENPVSLGDMLGGQIQGSWMLGKSPLSIDLALSYTRYNEGADIDYYVQSGDNWNYDRSSTSYDSTWALSLIPSINYHFYRNNTIDAYAGIGIGLSITRFESEGDADPGPSINIHDVDDVYTPALPRIGVLLYNHLHIGFEYYLYHKNANRGSLTIGYVF